MKIFKNSTFYKKPHNYIILHLSESKIKTAFDLQNVSENFSADILNIRNSMKNTLKEHLTQSFITQRTASRKMWKSIM